MKRLTFCPAVLVVCFLSAPAFADDWTAGPNAQFVQLPQLTGGVDVVAAPMTMEIVGLDLLTGQPYLGWTGPYPADDFVATRTAPLTEIVFWTQRVPDIVAVYINKPADHNPFGDFDCPGGVVWQRLVTDAEIETVQADGVFYNPQSGLYQTGTTQLNRMSIHIDPADTALLREGTKYWIGAAKSADLDGNGVVNWYDQVMIENVWPDIGLLGALRNGEESGQPGNALYTLLDSLGAVDFSPLWWTPGTLYSNPLTYPDGHPLAGQGMSLAFAVGSPLPGDGNADGVVDLSDLGVLASHYGQSGLKWHQGDFDVDGEVNLADLGMLAANWDGNAASIPEPASLALLGLGALTLLKRR